MKTLSPYQLGRLSYQNDEDLRMDNPYSKKTQRTAYNGFRKGYCSAKYYEETYRPRVAA